MMQKFNQQDVEVIDKQPNGGGFLKVSTLKLRHRLYRGGWSNEIQREVLERGHAVGVLLYDPTLDVLVLVEQFRVGALLAEHSPWLLEVPAGVIEEGESPEAVAVREVKEETGAEIKQVEKICRCLLSPGGCSEEVHLYYAEVDSSAIDGVHGVAGENEDIAVVKISSAAAFEILEQDFNGNAALVISLQWLQRKLHS